MSRAWSWRNAILASKLPATTKHVLMVISVHMNDMGEGCFPSVKRIAELGSISERSVCTHIEAAGDAGWLSVKTHGFNGQGWARHEYLPLWPEGTEANSVPSKKGTEPDAEGTEPNDKKALNEVQSIEPLNELPIEQPKVARIEIEFEEVWRAKWSRGHASQPLQPARKAYLAARRRGIKHAVILDGVKNRHGVDKPDTEYAPQLATWLNQSRWEHDATGDVSPAQKASADAKSAIAKVEGTVRAEFLRLSKLPENLRKSDDEIAKLASAALYGDA